MALTMVHLLAAAKWAENRPEYRDCPEYYLGAISPDAIHIRDRDDKSHKDYIHLYNWQRPHPEEVIAYWKEHGSPFDIGYGIHVLTDGQWVPRYVEKLSGMMKPDGRLDVSIYYNDTWATDFQIYNEDPLLPRLLNMIEGSDVPKDHPLLTESELDAWRKLTVQVYRGECPSHGEVRFVTKAYVLDFVADSTALMDATFACAFSAQR